MMFLVFLLSCMVSGSFACSDEHCKDPKLANELMEIKFLPSQAQLETLCPKMISFLECEKEFLECPGQTLVELTASSDREDATKAKAMLGGMSLVYDVCDEDSSFHQDYLESVDCFRDFIETAGRKCERDVAKPIEEFFNQIYPSDEDISEEAYAEIRCLSDAYEIVCLIDNLSESCGSVAKRTAMTVLERMKAAVKAGICRNVDNAADLKARFLDFLEPDDERRTNIQSVFDLIKKRR